MKKDKEKSDKEEKANWPATAEMRARISNFAKKYGIKITDTERDNLLKIVENLEIRLRKVDKNYRYTPHVSSKKGRDISKRLFTQKKSEKKSDNSEQTSLL
jgi:hypothetical protein